MRRFPGTASSRFVDPRRHFHLLLELGQLFDAVLGLRGLGGFGACLKEGKRIE